MGGFVIMMVVMVIFLLSVGMFMLMLCMFMFMLVFMFMFMRMFGMMGMADAAAVMRLRFSQQGTNAASDQKQANDGHQRIADTGGKPGFLARVQQGFFQY